MSDFFRKLIFFSLEKWEWRASCSGLSMFSTMPCTYRRSSSGYDHYVIML